MPTYTRSLCNLSHTTLEAVWYEHCRLAAAMIRGVRLLQGVGAIATGADMTEGLQVAAVGRPGAVPTSVASTGEAEGRRREGQTCRVGPFECFGHRFVIDTPDTALAGFLDEAYATMRASDAAGASVYYVQRPRGEERGFVTRDGDVVKSPSPSASQVLARLIWAINRKVIESVRHRLVFHSATAAWKGRAIVLGAPMECGKTTLVTGLIDRGFTYLTDEATVVDDDLMVEGYPKPLSIDRGAWKVLPHHAPDPNSELAPYFVRQWQVPATSIGEWQRRAPLAMLVFPRYEPGAGVQFERVSPATAVRYGMSCAFSPNGRLRVEALARLVQRVPAYSLLHDDLDGAHERLVDELDTLG